MPSRDNPDLDMMLSTLREVSKSTETIEQKIEILHPLLDLLQNPGPALMGYAERIIQLMDSYEQRIQSLENTVTAAQQALETQTARLDQLLSILESPAPD